MSATQIMASRISWPMTCVLMTACKAWNYDFEITGKTGKGRTADYGVLVAGVQLTPTQASSLIGQFKDEA